MSASEFVARCSGMISVSGSRLMTTPAAWVEALRATPSTCFASSTSLWTCGSPSYISRSVGRLLDGLVELDAELVRDGLRDAVDLAVAACPARDRRRGCAARASIVPKVMICATWSAPYLRVT